MVIEFPSRRNQIRRMGHFSKVALLRKGQFMVTNFGKPPRVVGVRRVRRMERLCRRDTIGKNRTERKQIQILYYGLKNVTGRVRYDKERNYGDEYRKSSPYRRKLRNEG